MAKHLQLHAGAAQIDITPTQGSFVGVDFYAHFARFMHDPLYAKVLLLKNEQLRVAIIVVDICIMSTEFMHQIKAGITAATGIPATHILLSSTHTHAAPAVIDLLACSPDLAYMKKLPPLVAEAVLAAEKKLQPAMVASGKVDVPDHVRCRRYHMQSAFTPVNPITGLPEKVKTNPIGKEQLIIGPAAKPDPELGFLGVKDLAGNWLAVLANYGLHYVGDWHVDSISADYFGGFAREITSMLGAGKDFVAIMSNGTSGDINIWDFMAPNRYPTEDLAKTALISKDLATKMMSVVDQLQWEEDAPVKVVYDELTAGIQKPTAEELAQCKKHLLQSDYNNLGTDEQSVLKIYAREQILLAEYPAQSVTEVQAIRIGSLVIGALGGEFFAETGLWLKENNQQFNYFTICLANSYDGYIAPAHEIEKGGYETWRARSSYLLPGSEETIRRKLDQLIKNVSAS
jgi:neutral ceramidase